MCTKIVTYKSNSGSTKHISYLFGTTPYGNYLKMKEQYSLNELGADNDEMIMAMVDTTRNARTQEREIKRIKKLLAKGDKNFKQLMFNNFFMKKMLELVGTLVCVYCGKPNLKIYWWMSNPKSRKNMATVDHFKAKANGGEAFNEKNCVIACWKCNNDKGNDVWSIRTLRYLSHYGNFKELVRKILG